jgi:hypothetical protein
VIPSTSGQNHLDLIIEDIDQTGQRVKRAVGGSVLECADQQQKYLHLFAI